jgi:hypothetical protein
VRQARRLVLEELRTIWNQTSAMVEEGRYPDLKPESLLRPTASPEALRFLPDEQWRANRAALARHLPDNQWDALSPFMDSISVMRAGR